MSIPTAMAMGRSVTIVKRDVATHAAASKSGAFINRGISCQFVMLKTLDRISADITGKRNEPKERGHKKQEHDEENRLQDACNGSLRSEARVVERVGGDSRRQAAPRRKQKLHLRPLAQRAHHLISGVRQ